MTFRLTLAWSSSSWRTRRSSCRFGFALRCAIFFLLLLPPHLPLWFIFLLSHSLSLCLFLSSPLAFTYTCAYIYYIMRISPFILLQKFCYKEKKTKEFLRMLDSALKQEASIRPCKKWKEYNVCIVYTS